jgi:predicted Zn-dependent protease
MKKIIVATGFLCLIQGIISCSQVPITGRRQMNLLPEFSMLSIALTSYKDFLSHNKVISTGPEAEQVKRVGKKIAKAITAYLSKKNNLKRIAGYQWEFNLVEDSKVNAWCMPGGKIVVYKGLLGVTQSEDALAVVMGHEVAHAIARHGNERMSEQLALQLGGIGLQVAIMDKPKETQNIFNTAFGIGTALGIALPHSRLQESEADEMGLIFMALAGYDPAQAVTFWQRMKAASKDAPPAFLSTHPSDASRIANMQKLIPKALAYRKTYGLLAP